MSAQQRLNNLLTKLENEIFYGEETTHNPAIVEVDYSPGYMRITIDKNALGNEASIEMEIDQNYNVTNLLETNDGQPNHWTTNEIKNREGFIGNYLLHDPRYVLHCAENIKDIQPDVYRMRVVNSATENARKMLGITLYADIYMINDDILQMDIIKQLKSKKEKLMRQVVF